MSSKSTPAVMQEIGPGGFTLPELGRRLRALREKRGMTLARLAEDAELSKGYISQIESGKKRPHWSTLMISPPGPVTSAEMRSTAASISSAVNRGCRTYINSYSFTDPPLIMDEGSATADVELPRPRRPDQRRGAYERPVPASRRPGVGVFVTPSRSSECRERGVLRSTRRRRRTRPARGNPATTEATPAPGTARRAHRPRS